MSNSQRLFESYFFAENKFILYPQIDATFLVNETPTGLKFDI